MVTDFALKNIEVAEKNPIIILLPNGSQKLALTFFLLLTPTQTHLYSLSLRFTVVENC